MENYTKEIGKSYRISNLSNKSNSNKKVNAIVNTINHSQTIEEKIKLNGDIKEFFVDEINPAYETKSSIKK